MQEDKSEGKFIMVVGPSGSGKGTLIKHIRNTFPGLIRAVTSTTRSPRPGEQDGIDRHFVSVTEFKQKIEDGYFLEWAEYGGNLYATSHESVTPAVTKGEFVLKDLEVQGARQILEKLPRGQLATIFIDAGPWEDMEKRIRTRAPISEEELAKRKTHYEDELTFREHADFIISNKDGELENAKQDFEKVIRSIIS